MPNFLSKLLAFSPNDPYAARNARPEISIHIIQQFNSLPFGYGPDNKTQIYSLESQKTLRRLFKKEYEEILNEEQNPDSRLKHLNSISFDFHEAYNKAFTDYKFAPEIKENKEEPIQVLQKENGDTLKSLAEKLLEIYTEFRNQNLYFYFYGYPRFSEYNTLFVKYFDLAIELFLDCFKINDFSEFEKQFVKFKCPRDFPYIMLHDHLGSCEGNIEPKLSLAARMIQLQKLKEKDQRNILFALLDIKYTGDYHPSLKELHRQMHDKVYALAESLAKLLPKPTGNQANLEEHYSFKAATLMLSSDSLSITLSNFNLSLSESNEISSDIDRDVDRALTIPRPFPSPSNDQVNGKNIGFFFPPSPSNDLLNGKNIGFFFPSEELKTENIVVHDQEEKYDDGNNHLKRKLNSAETPFCQLWYQLAKIIAKKRGILGIDMLKFGFDYTNYKILGITNEYGSIRDLIPAITCGLYYQGELENSIFNSSSALAPTALMQAFKAAANFILSDQGLQLPHGIGSPRENLAFDILVSHHSIFEILPRDEVIEMLNRYIRENNKEFEQNINRLDHRARLICSQIDNSILSNKDSYNALCRTIDIALRKHLQFKTPNLIFDTLFYKAMAELAKKKINFTYKDMDTLLAKVLKNSAQLENQILKAFQGDNKNQPGLKINRGLLLDQSQKRLVQGLGAVLAAGYGIEKLQLNEKQLTLLTQRVAQGLVDKLASTRKPRQGEPLFLPAPSSQGLAVTDFDISVPTETADLCKIRISQQDIQTWVRPVIEQEYKMDPKERIRPLPRVPEAAALIQPLRF